MVRALSTSFRVFPFLPIRRRWAAHITEFEWNRYFADVQDEGPFESWQHDVIEYEVGFGFLGSIANALFIRQQMQTTFAERQGRLPNLLR